MNISHQISKLFSAVYFQGNWSLSHLYDHLKDVTFQEAVSQVSNLNTILQLTYHIHYYVHGAVLWLRDGEPLMIDDEYSFDHPNIQSQEEWQQFLENIWKEAKEFARIVDALPDERLSQTFYVEKYGNTFRNLIGILEHTHYHLGQIVIIKKLLRPK